MMDGAHRLKKYFIVMSVVNFIRVISKKSAG
jgi:hypothetical protein